jgi:hypothetical protein
MTMLDLMGIYNKQIKKESEEYRLLNPKVDSLYRASSSGMCNRKIFFEAIEKAKPSSEPNERSQRIMKLGTIVHNDLQETIMKAFEDKD